MAIAFLRHNAVLVALLVGVAALLWREPGPLLAPALIGAAVFFASEYTTHRFAFHARPSRIPFVLRLQHRLHYDHHVTPDRLDLLFLPWWFSLLVASALAAAALAVTRNAHATEAVVLGGVLAVLWYEWVHYVAHIPFVPRTATGRWIKKYHLRHHFLNERYGFGVTNPIVDVLGGTFARGEASRSATVRNLYPRP